MSTTIVERLQLLRSERDHRLRRLPVLVLMPHSRCNCRCVMCDIWRANSNGRELGEAELATHLAAFRRLKPRWIVLSGGEPLMHSNLFALCQQLRTLQVRITLLSTGLLLKRFATDVISHVDDVIVSLDGSPQVHDLVRNVPRAYQRLAEGIGSLRKLEPHYPVTARCVVQRANFRDFSNILATAKTLALDQISFLPADVSSEAFNRPGGWPEERAHGVALTAEETEEFSMLLERESHTLQAGFESGFIAESPKKLRRIVDYYRALNHRGPLPKVHCNAPWVSAVIEADGVVRPCFFHKPYGRLDEIAFDDIINAPAAVAFRRALDVNRDPVCRRCVCTLKL